MMIKRYVLTVVILISCTLLVYPGDITISLTGNNPLLVNIKGTTQNEEAGSINIYIYYKNADLDLNDVDASQLVNTFGWGTSFEDKEIETGVYNVNSTTYSHRLFYGNADLSDFPNDFWSTSGVVAVSITFTNGSSGEAFIALQATDAMADWSGTPHNVSISPSSATPLPVELTSFTASANNDVVNLNWQTATEVNNYGFDIERRGNSQQSSVSSKQSAEGNWQKIGFVKGAGNSNSPKFYSFTDKNLTGGTKFKYRLKQIDIDGKFEYSSEEEVEIIPVEYSLSQNYPNPFNPVTSIKFELPQAAKVSLNVYNILGENVASLVNENLEAGFHSIPFNASALPSGTYIYRLQADKFVQTKKMILLK